MEINTIVEQLKKNIGEFQGKITVEEIGTVIEVGDGIAQMEGLTNCQASEMLEFPNNTYGVALNLEEGTVGAVILGDYKHIKEGDVVKRTGRILSIPVSEELIGRVVSPLGVPIDGKGEVPTNKFYPIEKIAPGVMSREPVNHQFKQASKQLTL